jgi:tetratricopeptide (TPR) repeat protein
MIKIVSIIIISFVAIGQAGCVAVYKHVKNKRDVSYKEGVDLFNSNKFADADKKFKVVMGIEPDYLKTRQYYQKTQTILKQKKIFEKKLAVMNYDKGMLFYRRGNFEDALRFFNLAAEQDPSHPDADDKIDSCREKLAKKFEALIVIAEKQYGKKQYTAAMGTCEKAKFYNPSNMKLSSLTNKIKDKLDDASEKPRNEGRKLYSKKMYAAAVQSFQRALAINPWDKESKDLLNKSSYKVNLDTYYQNAVRLFNGNDLFGAKSVFSQVNNVEPGYKMTEQYLTRINSALTSQIENFYNGGVAFYEKGSYSSAIAEFNKVLTINPGHAMAAEYRRRAESKMEIKKSLGSLE